MDQRAFAGFTKPRKKTRMMMQMFAKRFKLVHDSACERLHARLRFKLMHV